MHTFLSKKILFLFLTFLSFGQMIFAQNQSPLDIAQKHLQENATELNLTSADLENFKVSDNYTSKHNGVTHLYLIQRHEDIEVHNGMININILPSGKVLNLGNRFVSNLDSYANTTSPQITAKQAVEEVITHLNVPTDIPYILTESERISDKEITFHQAGIALEPIKTKLVFEVKSKNNVRLAWKVYLYEKNAQNWWNVRVDAVTKEILSINNHVVKCDFGHENEICEEDHNHIHTTNTPMATVDDVNNAYNVFPLYVESPIHGDQSLVVAPSNAVASPFGWHDTNGEVGEEYTITRGNNVHAYHDIFDLNQSIGAEPDGGDSLFFDFPYNLEEDLPYNQLDASTVNIFYWTNIIHDVFYQYGFDEVSGNFQENNYGNGGEGGDYVRAEAIDGNGSNNANFGTPPDGARPRKQMYYWGFGGHQSFPDLNLNVTAPENLVGGYTMVAANFGGELPIPTAALVGSLVLVNDGVGETSDGCQDLTNSTELNGNIALIDQGNCSFGQKALNAQNTGAIAVVFCPNSSEEPFAAEGGAVGDQVSIPVVMINISACNTLKMDLENVIVSFSDRDYTINPEEGPTGVDSGFDNGIIAHEYGHGISNRLTGGPNNTGCLSNPEQMGEGWSDFMGLVLTVEEGDTGEMRRGVGTFVQREPNNGRGIRQYPYSTDMLISPLTYGDVAGNAASVHAVGTVWCNMLGICIGHL